MKRPEFHKLLKSMDTLQVMMIMVHSLMSKEQMIEAIIAIANDCDINNALSILDREERLT